MNIAKSMLENIQERLEEVITRIDVLDAPNNLERTKAIVEKLFMRFGDLKLSDLHHLLNVRMVEVEEDLERGL